MAKKSKPYLSKATCCKDAPRCKRCPVVCKKLMKQGWAERTEKGRYLVAAEVPKKQVKLARS